jgi:hypothetical protein
MKGAVEWLVIVGLGALSWLTCVGWACVRTETDAGRYVVLHGLPCLFGYGCDLDG